MVLLPACAGPQSTLDAAGPSARAIALVWWWMLGVSAAVLAGVLLLWLAGMRRRRRPARPADPGWERRWLIGGGIVLPAVAIAALIGFGAGAGLHQLALPGLAPAPLRIDAVANQWRWEFRYGGDAGPRLDNRLRLPAGRPVDIHTRSSDVIHSFWVPALAGKLDAIPGRTLVIRLQAQEPGRWRGQCAEFCGLGHAHMVFEVEALPAAQFDAWLKEGAAR
ncbi:cytochrome c oxidase subunit II [Ramlibacter sp.]|uniref:cytochrome c oxidase subunit II n=1 Tax=Ramlibacter sp. TaxID=1917967 RepID=UPI003D096282